MWILQGLMVCCVIMGMSNLVQAESLQTKLKEYKQELKEDLKSWKVENRSRRKEIFKWKKKTISELTREKDLSLKKINDDFAQKIHKLGRSMHKKSHKFQLKSDLALVKSIRFKREKFNQTKKVLNDYYSDLHNVEISFNEKYKAFKLESFRDKQEVLNENKPDFFPNFSRYKKIKNSKKRKKIKVLKRQFCMVQRFYLKQQFNLDYSYSKYENIHPLEMNVKRLKNLKELASQEVEVLDESLNAIKIMVQQMGKTPKELKRLKKQMYRAKKSQKHYRKKYDEDSTQLAFLKNGLEAAKMKRQSQIQCNSDIMITNIQTPKNMNEHSRIGEVY